MRQKMPLVRVRYTNEVDIMALVEQRPAIREGIARILSSEDEGGALCGGDITLLFDQAGPYDDNSTPLFVDIEAFDFPLRSAGRQEHSDAIEEMFLDILGWDEGVAVWLKMEKAAYSSSIFTDSDEEPEDEDDAGEDDEVSVAEVHDRIRRHFGNTEQGRELAREAAELFPGDFI
jgi:hypothetical protein